MTTDLFGHAIDERLPGGAMCQRFIEPPFSVLDQRAGRWQDRKRDWLALGIKSEVGRGDCTPGGGGPNSARNRGASEIGTYSKRLAANTCSSANAMKYAGGFEETGNGTSGTSIFDPVLCELMYSWFMPDKPSLGILDPFAGGSVRGIVAGRLGYQYTGIDLRREQIEANLRQGLEIPCNPHPRWLEGDSALLNKLVGDEYDMLFTCPPYWNLERYSDDSRDLSTLDNWHEFIGKYRSILVMAARRLKSQRFAVVVVGNIRDGEGFIRSMREPTASAFLDADFRLYNEFILLTPIGSLPLRINGQFTKGRKAGAAHQYVQCFFRGNPDSICKDFHQFEES